MNIAQGEITLKQLLSLRLSKLALAHRRWNVKRQINEVMRDLELTNREIAERQEARRHLQCELMALKAERRSIGG